jgi:hypothetical protein
MANNQMIVAKVTKLEDKVQLLESENALLKSQVASANK